MTIKEASNADSPLTTGSNTQDQSTQISSIPITLAIYLRVSTEKQDINTSKTTQMNAINKYIEVNDIIVNKQYIYEDKYSASRGLKGSIDDAKPFTRKGLNELINDAKLCKFNTVMVLNHDRLTRNVQESLLLKYFFEKSKIKLIYCKPGENVDTKSNKLDVFFGNLLSNLAALESNMIGSRTRIGNEYNIKHGYWAGGPPPYGYTLNNIHPSSKKSILKICYPQARIVVEIFSLYLKGFSPVKIAELIKKKHSLNTDRQWTKNSIISIVNNEDYTGNMVWNKKGGVRNPVKHDTPIKSKNNKENIIINPEQWEQVKIIKAIQKKQPNFFSSPFILNGYLVCGKCGKIMKCKNNGVRGRVYYCIEEKKDLETPIEGKNKWETCIKAEKIEPEVIRKLGEHLAYVLSNDDNFSMFYEKYKSTFNSIKSIYEKTIIELNSQANKNNEDISKCILEISNLVRDLNYKVVENDEYMTNSNFIESLKELHSYLIKNGDIIAQNKEDVDKKAITTILSSDTLKKFILQKKNLLETIETISDKELYRRSLKLLIYDLVDKIVLSVDAKNIEIILK